MSLGSGLVPALLVVVGVRSAGLDPGIGMILLVSVPRAGGEILLGRGLPAAWISTLAGTSPPRQHAIRIVPVRLIQLAPDGDGAVGPRPLRCAALLHGIALRVFATAV